MNTQINLRLSEKLLVASKDYSEKNGFSTIQDFIKETIREKLFGQPSVSKKELALVARLVQASEKHSLYGTEEQLFKKLKGK